MINKELTTNQGNSRNQDKGNYTSTVMSSYQDAIVINTDEAT